MDNKQDFFYQDVSSGQDVPEYPEYPEDQIIEKSRLRLFIRGFLGFLIILGLIYVSGIYQAFFYRRTPANVEQKNIESVVNAETITVPIKAFILINDESLGSERTREDVYKMIINAEKIWNQADINFDTVEITSLNMSDLEISGLFGNSSQFLKTIDGYDYGTVNIFLVRRLRSVQGVNGLSFSGLHAVAIADLTTTYDFRVLAHEIGHVFGLAHVDKGKNRLMYGGADGVEITVDEAVSARKEAKDSGDFKVLVYN
jgi:hypothetical protein